MSEKTTASGKTTEYVFVNVLRLTGDADRLEEIYAEVADYFSRQPGFRHYELLRSEGDPDVYINIARWSDRDAFRRATSDPEFRNRTRVGEVAEGDPQLCRIIRSGGAPA
ncbi:antibiotic biosynthesis monooxygenase family protein [Nocardia concava]|uniref:antibiotic biosynthesis monooxygenase family protein n=1 Tax=Nocardia concava TaxID=257281 RepID=UPI000315D687|nr:antibiotic biosynthesis monooxygenase family protein [Nocardia concava]